MFLAVDREQNIFTSATGSVWALQGQVPATSIYEIGVIGSRIVASGSSDGINSVMYYSDDGVTWNNSSALPGTPGSLELSCMPTVCIAGGYTGVLISTDGINWVNVSTKNLTKNF